MMKKIEKSGPKMTKKKEKTMTELKIGTTSTENLGRRDAFHVPCVLVQSTHRVMPGDSVKFVDDEFNTVARCAEKDRHGIVDPFLTIEQLMGSEYFFILLNPNTVTKLVHHYDLVMDVPKSKVSKEKDDRAVEELARIEQLAKEKAEEIVEDMRAKFELEKEELEMENSRYDSCRGCY